MSNTEPETLSFRGDKAGLRARRASDALILHNELHHDPIDRSRASGRAWAPIAADNPDDSPFAPLKPDSPHVVFSIIDLATGELAGDVGLWGIDLHNRNSQVGLVLRPSFRGRGLGTDTVRLISHYAFTTRGLHRLAIHTLADNHAMIKTALAAGFTQEGTLRQNAWVNGTYLDEVILGRITPL
ncbi:GNAT family protein [Kineosporia mesophila]|uniref:GNAT family protein n=1 Tax=Kineosporia mesophila TaxID=566012 RepID=A0ABP6Z8A8_9ACTN|nr:GNAT family N-acetyltransferase [Kineosporia mesophila]